MSDLTRSEVLELRLVKPDEDGMVELRREVFHSLCNMALRMHGAEASADQLRAAAKEALHDLDRQPSPADARKRARATLRGALKAPVAAQEDT